MCCNNPFKETLRLELQAEKEELLHMSSLEKEEIIAKYEAEKQEAQEELEAICQVHNQFSLSSLRLCSQVKLLIFLHELIFSFAIIE